MAEFKDNLYFLRNYKRMTCAELARALGLGGSTIGTYETGRAYPTLPKLCKIADYFGVSLDWLVGRKSPEQSDTQKMMNALSKIYQGVRRIEEKK